jgi:hypothetical protein
MQLLFEILSLQQMAIDSICKSPEVYFLGNGVTRSFSSMLETVTLLLLLLRFGTEKSTAPNAEDNCRFAISILKVGINLWGCSCVIYLLLTPCPSFPSHPNSLVKSPSSPPY